MDTVCRVYNCKTKRSGVGPIHTALIKMCINRLLPQRYSMQTSPKATYRRIRGRTIGCEGVIVNCSCVRLAQSHRTCILTNNGHA